MVFSNILKVVIKLAVIWTILKCYYLVDLILDSVWIILFFYCKFSAFRIIGPGLWLEGSYELGSVCLSVLLSWSLLGIGSLVFFNFSMVLEAYVLLCMTAGFFKKISLSQKWENGPKVLLENLVIIFFWNWSVKKVHIICCSYYLLGKIKFLRYGPKCLGPIRLQDF